MLCYKDNESLIGGVASLALSTTAIQSFILKLPDYIENVYAMQEFDMDLAENVVLKGKNYLDNPPDADKMADALEEMLDIYRGKRMAPGDFYDKLKGETGDLYLGWSYDKYIETKEGQPAASIGLKSVLGAPGRKEKYNKSLLLKDIYLFQKEIENIFLKAAEKCKGGTEIIQKDQIDLIYDCGLLYVQLRRAADSLFEINTDGKSEVDEIYKGLLSVNKRMLYFDDDEHLPDLCITYDDGRSLAGYPDTVWWDGRYDEYHNHFHGSTQKKLSKDIFEPRYTPYIHLHDNGSYQFNVNLYEGMALLKGKWEIDKEDSNIAYLHKPTNVVTDINFDRLELRRVSESKFVLDGVENIGFPGFYSTSSGGDIYMKEGDESLITHKIEKYRSHDWAKLYMDFIDGTEMIISEWNNFLTLDYDISGPSSVVLYDIDSDGVPELFIEEESEGLFYILTIRNNKVVYLGYANSGWVVKQRNIETGEDETFIYGTADTDGGYFDVGSLKLVGDELIFNVIFWETSWIEGEENKHEFRVGDKEADIDTYAKELQGFINSYERIGEARKYHSVNYYSDWGDFHLSREKFIDVLCDYMESPGSLR